MHNGFDGLSGDVFIFINHRRSHIKLLQWQGDGFAISYKRLEKGTYEIPVANESAIHMETLFLSTAWRMQDGVR